MLSASDGHACPGGWPHLCVNRQAKLHGQLGVLISDPATNTGGQRRVAGDDQIPHVAQLRAGGLLDLGQLDTVSMHVRQLRAASDSSEHANQGSLTAASRRRRVGNEQLTEPSGRISDKHLTRASSMSEYTDVRSVSRRDVTTNCNNSSCPPVRDVTTNSNNSSCPPVRDVTTNSNSSCPPVRDVTTNSNNSSCPPVRDVTTNNNSSCVSVPPPLPPVWPDTTTSAQELLLGPDHIDMLLALAASNCTGNEMVSCCKMALQSSHVGNILRNYLVAVKYRLQDVMGKMINIIRRNFLCISRSREFLSLPLENLLIFMEDTHLNVQNELDMFVTGLLWIDYNKQERIDYAGRVLKCVRYAHIAPADILEYVEPNLHLFTGQDGAETLVNLYKHHAFTQSGQPVPGYSSMIPPRRGMHGVPARAYITSGGPDMHPTAGYGGLTCRAQRGPGAVPTDAASSSMRSQKTKVTFSPSTQFPPGDISPESESQLQTTASEAPTGETPAAGAEKGAANAEKGAANAEKGAANPEKNSATAEKNSATAEKNSATAAVQGASPQKGAITPAVEAASPEKGPATPAVGTAPPKKGAKAAAVGDKQPDKAMTTAVADDAQSRPRVNSATTSGKLPENVQDRSNNSGLRVSPWDSWVNGDQSILAGQAGMQQWPPSCQSGIEARFNSAGPFRASHVGHPMVSGCPKLYMTASGCQNQSRAASGCQNQSRAASGCQNNSMFASACQNQSIFASDYEQFPMAPSGCHNRPTTPSGCHNHHMVASSCQNHFMATCVAGQGWRNPVKGQPAALHMRHTPNACMAGQYSAVLETDAGRKKTSSLQYVGEQCQQFSDKQSHQEQVFVVTRSLSGPVVSIAYTQNDEAEAS